VTSACHAENNKALLSPLQFHQQFELLGAG